MRLTRSSPLLRSEPVCADMKKMKHAHATTRTHEMTARRFAVFAAIERGLLLRLRRMRRKIN